MRAMNRSWGWVVLLLTGLCCGAVAACGGKTSTDEAVPGSSSDKEESCAAACALADSCGVAPDDCEKSCAENTSVSKAGQDSISNCLTDTSCEPSEADLLDAVLCVTEELEDAELSVEQARFCSVTSERAQKCTGNEPDNSLGDCESQIALVSDDLLSDINGCGSESCEDFQSCVALQLLQSIDFGALSDASESGEIGAGSLSDLLALLVIGSQLGVDITEYGASLGIEDELP
jgi:hypothetical protein